MTLKIILLERNRQREVSFYTLDKRVWQLLLKAETFQVELWPRQDNSCPLFHRFVNFRLNVIVYKPLSSRGCAFTWLNWIHLILIYNLGRHTTSSANSLLFFSTKQNLRDVQTFLLKLVNKYYQWNAAQMTLADQTTASSVDHPCCQGYAAGLTNQVWDRRQVTELQKHHIKTTAGKC